MNFGRLIPPDTQHIQKFPLNALSIIEQPKAVPMVIGIDWYESFMPRNLVTKSGRHFIANITGRLEGGHAICVQSSKTSDYTTWQVYYDQRQTSECVGYSSSRMMTLLNREKYDPEWLYYCAQDVTGDPHDPDAGTYVRSAMEVLRTKGEKSLTHAPNLARGIKVYRWAQSVDEMRSVLQSPAHDKLQAFPLLNSWGLDYPHVVWMPYTVAEEIIFNRQ